MADRDDTAVLYEIALSVGAGADLDEVLRPAVSTMLRLLDCSGARVLQAVEGGDSGELQWRTVFSVPSPPDCSEAPAVCTEDVLPGQAADWPGWAEQLPVVDQGDGAIRLMFDLPGFGVLGLTAAGEPPGLPFLRSLQEVLNTLSRACLDTIERRRAEDALRESEAKYRSFVEEAVVGIYQSTPDGRYLSANPFLARLLGYGSPQEMMQEVTHIGEQQYAHPRDRETFRKSIESDGTVRDFETCLVRKDGARVWVSLNVRAVRDQDGALLHYEGTLVDITERKRIERELRESEERYKTIVTAMSDLIFVIDENDRFVDVHCRSTEPLAVSPEQFLGKTMAEIMPAPVSDVYGATAAEVRSAGENRSYEYSLGILGETRWFMASLDLHSDGRTIIAGIREITERKRIEQELRDQTEFLENITNHMLDLVSVTDMDAVFTYLNPSHRMLGYPLEEMLGTSALDYLHPEDLDPALQGLAELREAPTPEKSRTVMCRYRCVDGSYLWMEIRGRVLFDKDGQPSAMFFSSREISERVRAEQERERLQTQLAQVQKMESIGRLAGGVAHDFNNMLSVILGHAEMSLNALPADDPLREHLEEIQKGATRSAELTRQLLAFARKQTISPRILDLNEAVGGLLTMLRRLIGENINLIWLPGEDLLSVKVDPSQLDQILANLCLNARDAIKDVGRITIETGTAAFDKAYCERHVEFVPGTYTMLAVTDDGCGMDAEMLARAFEPFFTTKDVGKGVGLGLATVYGIVRQNEGFINAYSEPGQGTRVTIYLPGHAGEASEPVETVDRDDSVARGEETILLVEDEPTILAMLGSMLNELGYTVLAGATPSEAVQLAKASPRPIDLLLTDVVMPEMNGLDLARDLSSLYPKLKLLFMSGYTANVIAHHGVLDPGVHFIQKPFSIKNLAVKIRSVLDRG